MRLYFSPLACSMASRIALYEANAQVEYVQVDTKARRTADDDDFLSVNPLGLVPVLELEGGQRFTENAAILQLIAHAYPAAGLAPGDAIGRARLQQLLSFIGTELHKSVFTVLLDRSAPAGAADFARSKASARLAWIAAQLEDRALLFDTFSVADAYLFTVLNWSAVTGVTLDPWPALTGYLGRLRERPAVARALEQETALYLAARKPPSDATK
jgi:glutathione S-transferase